MVNYVKRAREIIHERGIKYLIEYSIKILKKEKSEKEKKKYIERLLLKIEKSGGLLGDYNFTYWWDRKKFDEITAIEHRDFWGEKEDFQYKAVFPNRSDKMFSFIRDNFWQKLDKEDHVAEIACASGETVFETAKFVKRVDGYEYSQLMVDKACETASEAGITNVSFVQYDATKDKLNQSYDAITILGLFTYILDDDVVEVILKNGVSHQVGR